MSTIGHSLKQLVCLQTRSCENITDQGIINFCESLSGLDKYKEGKKTLNLHEFKSLSKLGYLNISNNRALTDKAISSIAISILWNLIDFCFVDFKRM